MAHTMSLSEGISLQPVETPGQSATLPRLTAKWIDGVLRGRQIPAETEATCDACAMVPSVGGPPVTRPYNPHTKCCTYTPELPNYLVGAVLVDEDSDAQRGRATLEERLRQKQGVSPLMVRGSPLQEVMYRFGSARGFGTTAALLCPYYSDGRCSIWSYRNGVCSTWFCRHRRGFVGAQFWDSARRLITAVEHTLARWCLIELDVPSEALDRLFPANGPKERTTLSPGDLGVVDAAEYEALWGRWHTREREFFTACARLVDGLSWDDVRRIGGPELSIDERLLEAAFEKLGTDTLPSRCGVNAFSVVRMGPSSCWIAGIVPNSFVELPHSVVAALDRFGGHETHDALAHIATETGHHISRHVLRKMIDIGVLVAR